MITLLAKVLGRMPIGWLQLAHNKGRFAAAIAGVAFANLLVFVQLGIQGSMQDTGVKPYALFSADALLMPSDARQFSDGGNVARRHIPQILSVERVSDAAPLFIGLAEWRLPDGEMSSLEVYGIDPTYAHFLGAEFSGMGQRLTLADTAVVDKAARGVSGDVAALGLIGDRFEFNNRELTVVETVEIGGGFTADGVMLVSDQTFLRLFPNRSSAAPNRILIKLTPGGRTAGAVTQIANTLNTQSVVVIARDDAIAADLAYQTTERPTGIIFGFGVLMGVLVGIVIVYQVLSTDVANHIREYATFKAMGYPRRFFSGIVFEQALILAVAGFVPGLLVSLLLYGVLSGATGLPVSMDFSRAALVFLGTLAACVLSGLLAMRKLSAADPADLF